jgi:hypothetical protein|tara:strand:- start:1143 stop:1562 length:420 start_codon:yes stop_codon:yes gene_type:complete
MIDFEKEDLMGRHNDYHLLSGFDVAGNEWLWQSNDYKIVVLTSRPEFYSAITLQWLKNIDVHPACLIMRENEDYSSGPELKHKQLNAFYKRMEAGPEDIVGAYDDCREVVEMYCSQGISGHVIAIHNEHRDSDLYGKKE